MTGPMGRRVLKFDRAFGPEGGGGALRAQIIKSRSAPSVISTVAERSGEISRLNGQESITVGDLSTQRIIGAVPICHIPTRSPARDDDVGGQHWTHLRCEG